MVLVLAFAIYRIEEVMERSWGFVPCGQVGDSEERPEKDVTVGSGRVSLEIADHCRCYAHEMTTRDSHRSNYITLQFIRICSSYFSLLEKLHMPLWQSQRSEMVQDLWSLEHCEWIPGIGPCVIYTVEVGICFDLTVTRPCNLFFIL